MLVPDGNSFHDIAVSDDQNEYYFEYYYDQKLNTVVVNKTDEHPIEPPAS